jgi:pilus assembly protein Flp/PilA
VVAKAQPTVACPQHPWRLAMTNTEGVIMSKVLAYLSDDEGASAAEYALILAIVGTAIAAAMFVLGGSIHNAVVGAANCVKNASTGGC